MPRHPRIALTSRLRIHTISDKIGTRHRCGAGRCINARRTPDRDPEHSTQLDIDLMVGTRSPKATMPPRHRFLEPIHNVKERGEPLRSAPACRREDLVFIPGNWWSQSGSNRRPQACKASALPTELWPRKVTKVTPPTRAGARGAESGAMVGRVGVEPTTSRLSGVRSNHLSYRPPCQTRATRAAGGWMPAQVC
jgi:hypothetical protein